MNNSSGLLIVISGPSGCGKGTLLKALLNDDSNIKYSVSATTRAPREGETDGASYFFISRSQFEEKLASGDMLEHAEYCGNYYGTPRSYVAECIEKGNDVILEIDVVGAMKLKERGEKAVYIFVMPPSMAELRSRLIGRNTEDIFTVNKRLSAAEAEIRRADEYDYIVVNDVIDDGVGKLKAIILSEKCRSSRMKNIMEEVLTNA